MSQPPLFGMDFSQFGKMANRLNGRANAREKPNMPTTGWIVSPLAAPQVGVEVAGIHIPVLWNFCGKKHGQGIALGQIFLLDLGLPLRGVHHLRLSRMAQ